MSSKKKAPERKSAKTDAPKVGDTQIVSGIQKKVTSVTPTMGGGFLTTASADDFAKARGYRTTDEAIGYKVEHDPPTFVPQGTPRERSKLCELDWDFRKVLDLPLKVKSLALFHELARESARMREACRCYGAGVEAANELEAQREVTIKALIEANQTAECLSAEFQLMKAALRAKKAWSKTELSDYRTKWKAKRSAKNLQDAADHADSYVEVTSGDGTECHKWTQAKEFIEQTLHRFPYGVRNLETTWIAKDIPWTAVDATEMEAFLANARKAEAETSKARRRAGLRLKDVPSEGPGWPSDSPLQIAREWQDGRPCFHYHAGNPGMLEVASKGNGKDAEKVVTESLDVCVCFNFRDEEIIAGFTEWLTRRRASLPDELGAFRISAKRPYTKLNAKDVNAALIGLAALRLRFAGSAKEAAHQIQECYSPHKKQVPDIGNTQKSAHLAVEWQQMFFPHCPLDSEDRPKPKLDIWQHECPLCFRVWELPQKSFYNYDTLRCPWCDHREHMRWSPNGWLPYDY